MMTTLMLSENMALAARSRAGRMTGIEPALSTWELACHARPDHEPPGQRHGEAWEEVAAHGDSLGGTGEGSEIWTRNTQFLDQAVARAAAT
jgi:hypothetical protein